MLETSILFRAKQANGWTDHSPKPRTAVSSSLGPSSLALVSVSAVNSLLTNFCGKPFIYSAVRSKATSAEATWAGDGKIILLFADSPERS